MELIRLQSACLLIILSTSVGAMAKPTNKSFDLSYWEHVNKTCLSRDCNEHVNIAHLHHLATHMDRAIDPCDNFYDYACSHWPKQHPEEHTIMAVAEKKLTQRYQQIFEEFRERSQLKTDRVYEKLQHYYQVCLASERSERASWRAYVETLRGMGYLQLNNETHWLTTIRDLSLYSNVQYFITGHVERLNASRFMLNIDPHNTLERAQLTGEIYDILRLYNYTNDSLKEVEKNFQNLELDLENILNSSCLNAIRDENDECDLTEWLTLEQLLQSNSTINWKVLLAPFAVAPQDLIAVTDLKSLEKIKNYLDNSSQETLFIYAITRFLNHQQNHTHNIVDNGSTPLACLRHMRKVFPLAMNYIYEKVFYSPEVRALSDPVIESVFQQLKQQFSLRLDANQMQLSSDSIQYLKRKLSSLQLNIGNLPKNVTAEFYAEFVSDLKVSRQQNFFENHLLALRHFFQRQRLLAQGENISPAWFTFNLHMPDFLDALEATAYYFCSANAIVLPFAYLQLPFYDHRFWPSLLYGDLANTLGHELIHAFDTKFLYYDYGGNYNEQESLQILNNPRFVANRECLNRNPTDFLSERIADISGTRLALRTFVKDPLFLQHNGKLFFLQFAQFFCGSNDKETFAREDSSHDMYSLRLNYTLAHMPEFAEVFQCPVGSAMNPAEKCKLW